MKRRTEILQHSFGDIAVVMDGSMIFPTWWLCCWALGLPLNEELAVDEAPMVGSRSFRRTTFFMIDWLGL